MKQAMEFSKVNNCDSSGRLVFLDWSRGLAAIIMLQGHVFHSYAKPELRNDGPFVLSQFLGGMGPAIFLVLTGITLAFMMDRSERKGLAPLARWKTALRRGGYLFMLAFLFRLQLWIFGAPYSPWTDLLRVDILNCMGFGIALMSVMAIFTTADRVKMCAGLGLAIAAASPLVSSIDWTWMPPQLANYFVPSYQFFAFFPWAAFIAFGLSIGSLLRIAKPEHMNRIMQWGTLAGLILIVGGQYFSDLPYSLYAKSEFWLDSPGLIVIKLGVILLIMAFAFPLDPVRRWRCMELGAAARHHFIAGLLGAHRAGLRTLDRRAQGILEQRAMRYRGRDRDRLDDRPVGD